MIPYSMVGVNMIKQKRKQALANEKNMGLTVKMRFIIVSPICCSHKVVALFYFFFRFYLFYFHPIYEFVQIG